jgi:hypothetical protein
MDRSKSKGLSMQRIATSVSSSGMRGASKEADRHQELLKTIFKRNSQAPDLKPRDAGTAGQGDKPKSKNKK